MNDRPTCPLPTRWDLIGTEDDDAASHILGEIQIGTVLMHVEAIRVERGEMGYQGAATDEEDNVLDKLFQAVNANGPFQTTRIDGFDGEYVVFAYPHCE